MGELCKEWHIACLNLSKGAAGGSSYEDQFSIERDRPSEIQKAEEGRKDRPSHKYRGTLHGAASTQGAPLRGRIEAFHAMTDFRQKLARSAYLVALAASMAGWVWVLYEGVEWILGV